MNKIIIYTDGGARGNPGPAAVGVVIFAEDGPPAEGGHGASGGELTKWKQAFGEYIGETTNNEAEYRALIIALNKVKELSDGKDISEIECYADSELMVKQLNGEYKIKDLGLRGFFLEIAGLKRELNVPISFHHVSREKNAEADALVNEILDKKVGPKIVWKY